MNGNIDAENYYIFLIPSNCKNMSGHISISDPKPKLVRINGPPIHGIHVYHEIVGFSASRLIYVPDTEPVLNL